MCFLSASLWFLRELQKRASKTTTNSSQLYALMSAVRWCLEQACIITSLSLHPGMHLYISQLGLVAMLHAVELAGDLATPEDSKMVAHLLEIFSYNCRFCPFWHSPIVTISEAVLLNIISGKLHSEFILHLQTLILASLQLASQSYDTSFTRMTFDMFTVWMTLLRLKE